MSIIISQRAEIITLRAIALKHISSLSPSPDLKAEIITLRAIALKQMSSRIKSDVRLGRDHNATSYSTETEVALNPTLAW